MKMVFKRNECLATQVQLNKEMDNMEDVFSSKKTTEPSMYWFDTHVQLNQEMFADSKNEKIRERIKRFLKRKN